MARQRHYSPQTLKRLWALSGNECYMDGCDQQLAFPDRAAVMGVVAHIRAWSPGGPRAVPGLSDGELCSFENLLILCPTHHALVDVIEPERWSIEDLEQTKRRHEDSRHRHRLEGDDLQVVVELTIAILSVDPRPVISDDELADLRDDLSDAQQVLAAAEQYAASVDNLVDHEMSDADARRIKDEHEQARGRVRIAEAQVQAAQAAIDNARY